MDSEENLENGDDSKRHRNEQEEELNRKWKPLAKTLSFNDSPVPMYIGGVGIERPIFNDTEYYCKNCNTHVWINNDTHELIRNRFLGISFKAKYGYCRHCFICIRDIHELMEGKWWKTNIYLKNQDNFNIYWRDMAQILLIVL